MKATDKIQLLERVRTLDGLTESERNALLALINEHKTYGLVWEDKPEKVEERLVTEYPVLTEVCDRAIISDNPEAPNHILIEGDNLEALTTLAYTHEGKIDVIYIDPPYNTGNKDREGGFVYNDAFVDKEDSYRHSKWLSFMSRRLRIAKKLLSDRGVIFISIDDNEQAQLKMLCDEVFSQKNFVTNFVWEKKKKPSFLHRNVGKLVDYIVCYTKSADDSIPFSIETTTEGKKYPINNAGNTLGVLEFPAGYVQFRCKDQFFYPQDMSGGNIVTKLLDTLEVRNGRNVNSFRLEGEWRYSQTKLNEIVSANEPIIISKAPFRPNHVKVGGEIKKMKNMLTPVHYEMESNEDGTAQVADILGDGVFNNPKPLKLINKLILATTYCINDAIILDFFAGSGTTLHAVMQLNAEDGGKRQCILCQREDSIPGTNKYICSDVTYKRNMRVIEGYTKPNGEAVEGLHNNNLRYYRTDFVSRERTNKNRHELMEKSTNLLCIKEDLYTELPKFGRIGLNPKGARYFANDKKRMLIIYCPEFIPYFVEEIDKMELKKPIKVYVYAPARYAYDDEFAIVADKVSLCALPQNIIDAMARVMPDKASDETINAAAPTIENTPCEEKTLFSDFETDEA